MAKATIPFAGSVILRGVAAQTDRGQKFVNCFSYSDQDNLSGGRRIFLQKRQGLTAATVGADFIPSNGSCFWSTHTTPQAAFSFFNGTEMAVYNQATTQIGGNIANTSDCLSLTDTTISGTGNLVGIFVDSGTAAKEAWFYPEGGAWTQITDAEFPSAIVGPPAHLDGFMFVMRTNGEIWNSDLNSLSSWSANNFIAATTTPGIGLAMTKDLIAAFGSSSIEFYRNNGNASGSPLSRIENSTINIGALANSIRTVGDSVYFTGISADVGQNGFYQMTGMEIKKISTSSIEQVANGFICKGAVKTPLGFEHVLFGSGTQAHMHQPSLNRWWDINWAGVTNIGGAISFAGAYSVTYLSGQGQVDGIGRIYTMPALTDEYRDNGTALTMTVQTLPIDLGTDNWKTCSRLRLIGDKQSATATVTVSWSDDDAITFTSGVTIDMASANTFITRLGRFKRRVFKFTNATNTPLRLEAFELEYEVGTA